jgi:hypothetical protein
MLQHENLRRKGDSLLWKPGELAHASCRRMLQIDHQQDKIGRLHELVVREPDVVNSGTLATCRTINRLFCPTLLYGQRPVSWTAGGFISKISVVYPQ